MFDRIKNHFLRKHIEERKSDKTRAVCALERAATVGMLCEITDEDSYKAIFRIFTQLQNAGKVVHLIGYIDEKFVPFYCLQQLSADYFCQKQLTWCGEPNVVQVTDFIQRDFDILLDFNYRVDSESMGSRTRKGKARNEGYLDLHAQHFGQWGRKMLEKSSLGLDYTKNFSAAQLYFSAAGSNEYFTHYYRYINPADNRFTTDLKNFNKASVDKWDKDAAKQAAQGSTDSKWDYHDMTVTRTSALDAFGAKFKEFTDKLVAAYADESHKAKIDTITKYAFKVNNERPGYDLVDYAKSIVDALPDVYDDHFALEIGTAFNNCLVSQYCSDFLMNKGLSVDCSIMLGVEGSYYFYDYDREKPEILKGYKIYHADGKLETYKSGVAEPEVTTWPSTLEATYEAASGSCRGTLTVSRVEYLLTPQQAADVVSGLAGGGARAARPPRTGEGDMIG